MSSLGNIVAGLGALGRGYSQGLDMYEDRKVKERKRKEAEQRKALGDEFLNTFYTQEPVQTGSPMQSGLDNMPATKGAGGSMMLDVPQIDGGGGSRQPARSTSGNAPPVNGLTNKQQQGGWRVRDDLSVEDLSKKYMDFQMRAAMVPGAAEQYQPLFNAMKSYGVSRYMEDFDGDITTLEGASQFFQRQGEAMAMFGDAMDPGKVVTMARALSADRRDQTRLGLDQQRFDLTKQETEQRMRFAENKEGRADAKESRDQETFDLERAKKESEAFTAQMETLTNRLNLGDTGGAQQLINQLYPGATLGETKTETVTVGDRSVPVVKFQITDQDGNSQWYDTRTLNVNIGQAKGWREPPSKDKDSKPTQFTISTPGEIPGSEVETRYQMDDGVAREVPLYKADGSPAESPKDAAETDLEKEARQWAKRRVKEMAGWLSGDKKDFADYGGSRAEAERQLTNQYIRERQGAQSGPANGLTAPGVAQPTKPTQPGEQKPVEAPQLEEGAQFADPSRGIIVIQGGKETVAWANGEQRRGPDGKIYELKNGKPVPVQD